MERLRPFIGIILLILTISTLVLAVPEGHDNKYLQTSNTVPQRPTLTTIESVSIRGPGGTGYPTLGHTGLESITKDGPKSEDGKLSLEGDCLEEDDLHLKSPARRKIIRAAEESNPDGQLLLKDIKGGSDPKNLSKDSEKVAEISKKDESKEAGKSPALSATAKVDDKIKETVMEVEKIGTAIKPETPATSAEKVPIDKTTKPEAAEKVPTDKPTKPETAEKVPTDKPTKPEKAEKVPTDKPTKPETAEKVPTDKPTKPEKAEKVPTDKPTKPETAEKVPTDKPTKPETSTTFAEKAPIDKPLKPEPPTSSKVPENTPETPTTSVEKVPADKPTRPETPGKKPVPESKPQPTLQQSYYDYIHGLMPSSWRTNSPGSDKMVDAVLHIPSHNPKVQNIPTTVLFKKRGIVPMSRLRDIRATPPYKGKGQESIKGPRPEGEFKAVKSPDGRWLWHWFGLGSKDDEGTKPSGQSGHIQPDQGPYGGNDQILVNDKGEIEWEDVIILKPLEKSELGESVYDCPWKPKRKRTTPPNIYNNIGRTTTKSRSFFGLL